jgi:hypothetical protein
MAIVNTGDDLVAPILQSGWTVVSDGFGLNTSVSVFKGDTTTDVDAFLVKGTAHPDAAYSYLKLDKWRISWDSLDICTITVDYVGIDPAVNEGARTNPNTSAANGLTSEPITSHPSFFTADPLYAGAIAGPSPYTQSSTGPLVQSKTTPIGQPTRSYMGSNGACFESENGGRFIGFVDPSYPSLYGKTNYLATTTSYSGVIYSTTLADVQALLALLNSATATNSWGIFDLLPDWAPVGTASGVGHKNLLSQVNVQEFGSLYKINYEIRYAKNGWDAFVYTNI